MVNGSHTSVIPLLDGNMSPAAVTQKSQDQHLQSLARAFAALLITTQQLSCKEKELQQQVKYAHEEVCGISKKNFFLFFFFRGVEFYCLE